MSSSAPSPPPLLCSLFIVTGHDSEPKEFQESGCSKQWKYTLPCTRVLLTFHLLRTKYGVGATESHESFVVSSPPQRTPSPLQQGPTICRRFSHLSESWSTGTRHASSRGLILPRMESTTLVSSTITSNRSPTSSFTILDRVCTTPDIHLPRKK